MTINNPYIDKVKWHNKILIDSEKIYSNKWIWYDFFWNKNPLILEIGTWLWNFFSSQVLENPLKNYIWMEIKYKRLFKTAEKSLGLINNNDLSQINDRKLNQNDNFVLLKDYWEHIDKIFNEWEIEETYIFFPDPWDKNEKTKIRRLLSEQFLNNLYLITKNWWKFIFKTDHIEYFDYVLEWLKLTNWIISLKTNDYENDWFFTHNKITEFEQIFRWQNFKVNYLECIKNLTYKL